MHPRKIRWSRIYTHDTNEQHFVIILRYSEGVTDVSGSSITMVGAAQPVFSDFQRGLMETK